MESSVYSYIASLILLWNQLPPTKSSVNLALNKITSQSSNFSKNYPPSNAVDGQNKHCSNVGLAHTLDREFEWWQVDLGEVCEIKRIQIYHRINLLNRLGGYAIDIIKSLNPLDSWQCYKDTDNIIPTDPAPSHICPSFGRYVKFSREKTVKDTNGDKAVINLCELEVYGCPQGRYGNNDCNSECSVGCLNSRCDPDNGQCNCSSGLWSGEKCDHILCSTYEYLQNGTCKPCSTRCQNRKCKQENGECLDGCVTSFYGTFCNLTCSANCYNKFCERNGRCYGCKSGFYGNKCNATCQWNCKDKVCIQEDGFCTSCNHPYKGNTCTECVDGYYGKKCTNCSEGCLDRKCDHISGHCTCIGSFFGSKCEQSCPAYCNNTKCNQTTGDCVGGCKTSFFKGKKCNECADGMYGGNCEIECPSNCNLTKCNRMDGFCSTGCIHKNMIGNKCEECSDGFYGISCNLTCSKTCNKCIRQTGLCALLASDNTGNSESQKQTNNTGPIIGGIVAVIVVIVIVVVIVLFLKRRRRKETVYENQKPLDWAQGGRNQQDNNQLDQQQTVHYETLCLHDRGNVNTNSVQVYTGLNVNTQGRY